MLLLGAASAAPWPGRRRVSVTAPTCPISHRDRLYAAEQFSNTVSVTDPADNRLLGVIRLGDPAPGNFSPLYRGQVLVHGMGFSPDHRTLAVVSIGSNSVSFIDTATNAVKHVTYVGRSPHEAFYTPDGKEVWVTVRGENYISVIDAATFQEKTRIYRGRRPAHADLLARWQVRLHLLLVQPRKRRWSAWRTSQIVGRVKQESPFCPNIAATPDGKQVWFTLKDIGKARGVRGAPAVPPDQDAGDRPDHQPRELRHHRRRATSPTSRWAGWTRSRCSGPTTSPRWPRFRWGSCRTASGPRATATRI